MTKNIEKICGTCLGWDRYARHCLPSINTHSNRPASERQYLVTAADSPCSFPEEYRSIAQNSSLCREGKLIDFQKAKEAHDQAKRTEAYDRIAHLADHLS